MDRVIGLSFTNLNAFYDLPTMFPPIWLSVHDTVELQPKAKQDYQMNKIRLKSRDLRPSNRLDIRSYFDRVELGIVAW